MHTSKSVLCSDGRTYREETLRKLYLAGPPGTEAKSPYARQSMDVASSVAIHELLTFMKHWTTVYAHLKYGHTNSVMKPSSLQEYVQRRHEDEDFCMCELLGEKTHHRHDKRDRERKAFLRKLARTILPRRWPTKVDNATACKRNFAISDLFRQMADLMQHFGVDESNNSDDGHGSDERKSNEKQAEEMEQRFSDERDHQDEEMKDLEGFEINHERGRLVDNIASLLT